MFSKEKRCFRDLQTQNISKFSGLSRLDGMRLQARHGPRQIRHVCSAPLKEIQNSIVGPKLETIRLGREQLNRVIMFNFLKKVWLQEIISNLKSFYYQNLFFGKIYPRNRPYFQINSRNYPNQKIANKNCYSYRIWILYTHWVICSPLITSLECFNSNLFNIKIN